MVKKASIAERRRSPRRVPRVGVTARVRRPGGDNVVQTLLNISQGGIGLVASERLIKGEAVEVVLHGFGHIEPLHLEAVVIWAKPMRLDASRCCAGIAFNRPLTADELAALASA
jgi:hypothetical protein